MSWLLLLLMMIMMMMRMMIHLREELLSITRPGYVDQSTKATPLIDHRHSSAESIHFAKHVRQLVSHFASTHPPRCEKIVSSVKTRLCEVVKCRLRGLMQVLIVLWGEILYLKKNCLRC